MGSFYETCTRNQNTIGLRTNVGNWRLREGVVAYYCTEIPSGDEST